MEKIKRLSLLLCCFTVVLSLGLGACSNTSKSSEPSMPTVVSVDRTGGDETSDTYTMKFSDGSTYVFSIDKESGNADESVYELFVKHNPDYVGDEAAWLQALLDGTLFDKPPAGDGRCVLDVTVTDEKGNALGGAYVRYGDCTFIASGDGKCSIVLDGGGDITVSKAGYIAFTKEISTEDIANAGSLMTLSCKLSSIVSDSGYNLRSNNYLTFSIPSGGTVATYYWYVEYENNGIRVYVDVFDNDIVWNLADLGMNDNIEFIIQRNVDVHGLSVDNSLNVLAALGRDGMWARIADNGNSYNSDISASLISIDALSINRTRKIKLIDGVDYTSIEVLMDYSIWDITREEAVGNFTIAPAARNSSASGDTYFRSYVGYDCIWADAAASVRIGADGQFSKNYFDLPDLETRVAQMDGYVQNTALKSDMAVISSETASVREYKKDAPLFTDRAYFVYSEGIPSALDGVGYLYGAIDVARDFKIESDGYAVIAVPGEGAYAAETAEYLTENGFEKIAAYLPCLGHGAGSSFMSEHIDYYAKYCTEGEEFVLPKYGVVYCRAQEEYDKNNWEVVAASVITLDTALKVEKFAPSTRLWQGIPGIESVTKSDGSTRLFACWFTGADKEPRVGNYAVVYYSDDGGSVWVPAFVVGFEEDSVAVSDSRVFDPSLFVDDNNDLWLWWNQTNATNAQVTAWYTKISNAADGSVQTFTTSEPVMASYGLKMNKPTKLSTGEWLYCAHDFTDMGNTKVYSSTDNGVSWNYKGTANVPNARFANESALVETTDDSGKHMLIMWNRCTHSYCVSISYSYDYGATWTDGAEFYNNGPSSRMNACTLPSGNILYVHHYNTESRTNLCIFLSTDGGKTLPHALVLDTRYDVSYPDIAVSADGKIYVIWDFNRYVDKQILMTVLTEDELLGINGTAVLDRTRIKTVSSLTLGDEHADVNITVTDGDSPIAGATVTLSAPYMHDVSVTTNDLGIAEFIGIAAEEYVVTVTKAGYGEKTTGLVTAQYIDAIFTRINKTVVLEQAELATITGVVTDMFTGEAIADAAVSVGGISSVTDSNGMYSLDGVDITKDLLVTAEGYDQKTISLGSPDDGEIVVNAELAHADHVYIGEVGGLVGSVDTIVWQVYILRNDNGINAFAVGSETVPNDGGLTQFSIWFHVGEAGTTRTKNTANVDFLSSGRTRSANYPSNVSTTIHGLKDNTAEGLSLKIRDNVLEIEMTYAAISKACATTVDKDTLLGINLLGGKKVGNTWYFAEWHKEQTVLNIGTGLLPRSNPSVYPVMHSDGHISLRDEPVETAAALNALVMDSSIGKADMPLTENMAAFDVSSRDVVIKSVKTGSYMFSDRTTHRFDGNQIQAVEGMSFLYDGVLASSSVVVTKAGYFLMYAAASASVGTGWIKIIDVIRNPGLVVTVNISLYALWADEGDVVEIVSDGILMTNGISTEILVFGDSYTDAHVRKYWKNWDTEMAPYGAITIGISGSRIDTPTGGDPYGWITKALSGEVAAYNPKKILINLGVNDIDNGLDAHTSATQLIELLTILHEQLPNTDIYYTLIVDNPMYLNRANQYRIHNERVSAFIDSNGSGKLHVIDFRDDLYTKVRGIKTLKPVYYADNLHLSAEGYTLWVSAIYREMGISLSKE